MSFWDSISNLFRQAESSSINAPTIHEMIERTEAEREAYARWRRTESSRRLLGWIEEQYAAFHEGHPLDEAIGFLNTNSSKGFVLYVHKTNYSLEELTHFFDYFKEKILSLDYRPGISDRRIFPRRDWVETRERHYLKPNVNLNEAILNQGFGNITVELELRNDVPHNLRLRATVYQDSMYQDAGSFGALMAFLVG